MKLLRIIADSNPRSGGPIEGARQFAAVWARHGHRQDLLTLDAPGEQFLDDYPGEIIGLGPIRSGNPLHKYRYSVKMVPWLKQHAHEYDAVLISGLWRYVAMGARRALANSKTPYFVLPHGMLDPWFRTKYPLKHWGKQISWLVAEGPLIKRARGVLFTSAEEMHLANNAFWPYHSKGLVINYGTQDVSGEPASQIAAFRDAIPSLGNRRYILFLSRIHEKKGCDLLVEAFADVANLVPDLDLVIAGPDQSGLVNQLKKIATEKSIAARIHFPGMLVGDTKTGAFRGAEAFVLPSHQENFGIVVAEALSCRTPVLISNKVNIWREVVEANAGIVESDDLIGTTKMLRAFLGLTDDRKREMSENARACFIEKFHAEKSAIDLINMIKNKI